MSSKIVWPPELRETSYVAGEISAEQQVIDTVLGCCHTDGRSKQQLHAAVDTMLARVHATASDLDFRDENPYRW